MKKRPIHVAILAARNSIHTVRWINALVNEGVEIDLITLHKQTSTDPIDNKIKLHLLPFSLPFGYLLNKNHIKKIISEIKPDVVHAIYAGGYGTLLRIANFHPSIISAIGSDVDDTKLQSKWRFNLVQSNLNFSDQITVNSNYLGAQVKKFKINSISKIIPFGVDTDTFKPSDKTLKQKINIGTVKTLEYGYGIDILIKAFALICKKYSSINLIIVGQGSLKSELVNLTRELKIDNMVMFIDQIQYSKVPTILNKLSIFACLSRKEGFGVSVIEASACGLPVVVSDVGGLPETLIDGKTGFIVKKDDPVSAAKAIEKLINDPKMRKKMGQAGRKFVIDNYNWNDSVHKMINLYTEIV